MKARAIRDQAAVFGYKYLEGRARRVMGSSQFSTRSPPSIRSLEKFFIATLSDELKLSPALLIFPTLLAPKLYQNPTRITEAIST